MLFNSFEYLFFLPIVFILYWLSKRNLLTSNTLVVAASYVFYGWWDWRFLFSYSPIQSANTLAFNPNTAFCQK